jgi:hypothetical protein
MKWSCSLNDLHLTAGRLGSERVHMLGFNSNLEQAFRFLDGMTAEFSPGAHLPMLYFLLLVQGRKWRRCSQSRRFGLPGSMHLRAEDIVIHSLMTRYPWLTRDG